MLGEKIKEAKEELEKWDLKGEISDLSEEEVHEIYSPTISHET